MSAKSNRDRPCHLDTWSPATHLLLSGLAGFGGLNPRDRTGASGDGRTSSSGATAGASGGSPMDALTGGELDPLLLVAGKVTMAVATHPLDYGKTLMQIGYEPVAPVQSKSLLGKPILALPSIISYVGYIKNRDGFLGLYAGLVPRVLEMPVTYYTSSTFNKYWPDRPEDSDGIGRQDITEPAEQARMWRVVSRGAAHRLSIVLATQPLQVIVVRCMAQFIGREDKYNGALSAIKEIFEQNGLLGFWSGLIPRAIGEMSLVCLTTAILHFLNRYIFTDKEYQQFTSHIGGFLATSLVYPFTVVSKCMIVSSSGLAAGYPPHMPFYRNWLDCYKHLKSQNALKRGASLFFRKYSGPQVIVGDRVLPVNRSLLNKFA